MFVVRILHDDWLLRSVRAFAHRRHGAAAGVAIRPVSGRSGGRRDDRHGDALPRADVGRVIVSPAAGTTVAAAPAYSKMAGEPPHQQNHFVLNEVEAHGYQSHTE